MIKVYKEEDLKQGSEEWLNLRRKYGTASEASSACEVSPWIPKSRLQLWELKHGELEIKQNFAMSIGSQYEDSALEWYERESKKFFLPLCIVDDETFGMPLMASLDGQQYYGGTEIVEIKVPLNGCESPLWLTVLNGEELPLQYRMQMEQQMMLSKESFCNFVVYDWKNKDGQYIVYQSDPEIRETILDGWKEYFKGKPEAGPLDIVKRDDKVWLETTTKWIACKGLVDEYTKELKNLRHDLIYMCDNQSHQGNGVRCRRNNKTGTWTVGEIK